MAFTTEEILEELGMARTPETEIENESETPEPTSDGFATSAVTWLMRGADDDAETESAPSIAAKHPRRTAKRKAATTPETGKTTVEQIPVEITNDKNPRHTYHMTTRRISHNG